MFRAPDIAFDPIGHVYTLPDGTRVPSVTQILKATGVATDFEALPNKEAIERKRDIGTACHADCHAYDDDDLAWPSVHPDVLPYVEAWAIFREQKKLVPLVRERIVFNLAYFYCGTFDRIFELPDGRRVLIDTKVGDPRSAAGHLQTAAYEKAFLFEHPTERIDERWAVQLCPEFLVPYRVTNYTQLPDAWMDAQKFYACVTVFNEQPGRRVA